MSAACAGSPTSPFTTCTAPRRPADGSGTCGRTCACTKCGWSASSKHNFVGFRSHQARESRGLGADDDPSRPNHNADTQYRFGLTLPSPSRPPPSPGDIRTATLHNICNCSKPIVFFFLSTCLRLKRKCLGFWGERGNFWAEGIGRRQREIWAPQATWEEILGATGAQKEILDAAGALRGNLRAPLIRNSFKNRVLFCPPQAKIFGGDTVMESVICSLRLVDSMSPLLPMDGVLQINVVGPKRADFSGVPPFDILA